MKNYSKVKFLSKALSISILFFASLAQAVTKGGPVCSPEAPLDLSCDIGARLSQLNLFDSTYEIYSPTAGKYVVEYEVVVGENIYVGCSFPDDPGILTPGGDLQKMGKGVGNGTKIRELIKRSLKDKENNVSGEPEGHVQDEDLDEDAAEIFHKLNASESKTPTKDEFGKSAKVGKVAHRQALKTGVDPLDIVSHLAKERKHNSPPGKGGKGGKGERDNEPSLPARQSNTEPPQKLRKDESLNFDDSQINGTEDWARAEALGQVKNDGRLAESLRAIFNDFGRSLLSSMTFSDFESPSRSRLEVSKMVGSALAGSLKDSKDAGTRPGGSLNGSKFTYPRMKIPSHAITKAVSQVELAMKSYSAGPPNQGLACKRSEVRINASACGMRRALEMTYSLSSAGGKRETVDVVTGIYVSRAGGNGLADRPSGASREDAAPGSTGADLGRNLRVDVRENGAILSCVYYNAYPERSNGHSCVCPSSGRQLILLKVRRNVLRPTFLQASMEIISLRPNYIFYFKCRISRCLPPIRLSLRVEFDDGTYEVILQDFINDMRYTWNVHEYIVPYEIERDQLKNFTYTCYWNFEKQPTMAPNSITLYHKSWIDFIENSGINLYLHQESTLELVGKSKDREFPSNQRLYLKMLRGQSVTIVCQPLFAKPTDFTYQWYMEESLLAHGQTFRVDIDPDIDGAVIHCKGTAKASNPSLKATVYVSAAVIFAIDYEGQALTGTDNLHKTAAIPVQKSYPLSAMSDAKSRNGISKRHINHLTPSDRTILRSLARRDAEKMSPSDGAPPKFEVVAREKIFRRGILPTLSPLGSVGCFDDSDCQQMAFDMFCSIILRTCFCPDPKEWHRRSRKCIMPRGLAYNFVAEGAKEAGGGQLAVQSPQAGSIKGKLGGEGHGVSWKMAFLTVIVLLAMGMVLIMWLSTWVHQLKRQNSDSHELSAVDLANFANHRNLYSEHPSNYSPHEVRQPSYNTATSS